MTMAYGEIFPKIDCARFGFVILCQNGFRWRVGRFAFLLPLGAPPRARGWGLTQATNKPAPKVNCVLGETVVDSLCLGRYEPRWRVSPGSPSALALGSSQKRIYTERVQRASSRSAFQLREAVVQSRVTLPQDEPIEWAGCWAATSLKRFL